MKPNSFVLAAAGLVIATAFASPVVLASAGKVLLVTGTATLNHRGSHPDERELARGDVIEVGDVIAAHESSRVQLLMADGARIELQAESSIRIDEFALPANVLEPGPAEAAEGAGKSVATLFAGRLRASPGAIGGMTVISRGRAVVLRGRRGDFILVDGTGEIGSSTALPPAITDRPQQAMSSRSPLGLAVELNEARLPPIQQTSAAIVVPASSRVPFSISSTERSNTLAVVGGGNVVQLNAPFGSGIVADDATYLSGTAALVDFGLSGSSGIRWGRWSTGSASVTMATRSESIDLQNASLHWIAGPTFEMPPVLPRSGSINFTLAGGTSPTDTSGHVGVLGAGTLTADFTAQQVSAALSLDVNGYNWFASGSAALTAASARFSGTFGTVLVDGRVQGNGAFSGFLSAGPLTPDQLNGAGLSYWLVSGQGGLGTVSGVAAFVPGAARSLTPPPVKRDVAYAAGGLAGAVQSIGVAANIRGRLLADAEGNLTRFDAPLPSAPRGTFAIGVAEVVNEGFDSATGLRWGRWDDGAIDVTAPPSSSHSHDLAGESLHWIVGNEFGASPVLPQSGTAAYTLIGNTDPTDTLGNTGTLGVASFNADFTNRAILTQLTLSIAGREWYASGRATYASGGNRFTGAYDDVRIDNLVRGNGTIAGFFSEPRIASGSVEGAGLSYNLQDEAGQLGIVSGVLAFTKDGSGSAVPPPVTQSRDIATTSPDFASGGNHVQRALPGEYDLDTDFGLTSMPGVADAMPARYSLGTSSNVESNVSPLVMLRWGRWSGGNATVTNLATGVDSALDLSQRSLHWIQSADSAAPPVMPQFGTASYALIGATSPTDRAGHVGLLNNATLSADFTNQVVSTSMDLTVDNVNFVATGNGSIGPPGLAAHQFAGSINSGTVSSGHALSGIPQGTFSGFFSAPGGTTPGVPGGAALTYTITDGQGGMTVDGAAAFRRP